MWFTIVIDASLNDGLDLASTSHLPSSETIAEALNHPGRKRPGKSASFFTWSNKCLLNV